MAESRAQPVIGPCAHRGIGYFDPRLRALPAGFTSEGRAINDLGQVTGVGRLLDQETDDLIIRAFLWSEGEMTELGSVPGFNWSAASDINDAGQIVGSSAGVDGNPNIQSAFIWQDGMITDLNDLIPSDSGVLLRVGRAMNNAGQISGWGSVGGDDVAFLLTPVTFPIGDLSRDCRVTAFDLALLLGSWGSCEGCPADLNDDDAVNAPALAILLGNWG